MVPQRRTFSPKEIINMMNLEILKIWSNSIKNKVMAFKTKMDLGTKRKRFVPKKKPLQSYTHRLRMG